MCGICGIYDPAGDPAARQRRVEAMSAALRHRGPDHQGSFADAGVTLGFRRLAVIDLETGQQPIQLDYRNLVIVLNGEIYNFRELRKLLPGRPAFRTKGDVEVVLHLFAHEGVRCLERLNGMFALAIWDGDRQTLYLARDRFGIKPLFVASAGGALAFSSEIRALAAGGFPPEVQLDPIELCHYLAYRHASPAGSLLSGVRALQPGTVLEVSAAGECAYSYLSTPKPAPARSFSAAAAGLSRHLRRAVARQLVADVPVGVFLSGGLDSSTVAALAIQENPALETFSIGFEGLGAVNELPFARRVAQSLACRHHETVLDAGAVRHQLPAILAAIDQPVADPTLIPTWFISRLARQRVVVALSGEGADEVFGGYPRQRYDVLLDRLGPLGRALLPVLLRRLGRRVSPRLAERLKLGPGLLRYLDWGRVFSSRELEDLLGDHALGDRALAGRLEGLLDAWEQEASRDPINARLDVDLRAFLPGDLLPKVDQMSMSHSLEVRVPYLDNEVFEFVHALPGRFKVGSRGGKLLLRRAAPRSVPAAVLRRPKQGFDVPIGAWLRGELRDAALQPLLAPTSPLLPWVNPATVSRLISEHLAGREHGERLWALVALDAWLRNLADHRRRAWP